MWMPIPDIGKIGIQPDPPAHLLPPGAWSDGRNIKFSHGRVFRDRGIRRVYGDPLGNPYWGANVIYAGDSYWLYSSLTKLYSVLGDLHTNVTRQDADDVDVDYGTEEDFLWNGGNLSNRYVLTNGVDVPQSWTPGTRVEPLVNWPADDLTCRILRPFGYFLVALNLTDAGVRLPNRIRWSNPIVTGALPTSWETDDASVEAGESDLPDVSSGGIIEAQALRNRLFIYKRNVVHSMHYVGGNNIFAFTPVFTDFGPLASGCVAPFAHRGGEFHCVYMGSHVRIHDGRAIVRTLDGRVSRILNRELSADSWRRSYVLNRPGPDELWICYPSGANTYPNRALVWNYREDTTTFRDMPENSHWMTKGNIEGAGEDLAWDSDEESWAPDDSIWDETSVDRHTRRPIVFISSGDNRGIHRLEGRTVAASKLPVSQLERTNICFIPNRQTKEPMRDLESKKLLSGLRLQITGSVGVRIGANQKINGATEFGPLQIVGGPRRGNSITRVDHVLSGVGFAVRFESIENSAWELHGYELDITKVSTY